MTLRELLDQGYRLKPWLEAEDYLIDYDAEVPEHGCDHENKIIVGVRVKQNYKPISFVLQYIFEYGEQVLISYDFASDRIEYPRFEEIEPALFFQYDELLMYDIYDVQDLKEKIYSYSEIQK